MDPVLRIRFNYVFLTIRELRKNMGNVISLFKKFAAPLLRIRIQEKRAVGLYLN
jgi:hypothetical protein